MEENLSTSIARNVCKQCSFSEDEIKDLFYIFKVKKKDQFIIEKFSPVKVIKIPMNS